MEINFTGNSAEGYTNTPQAQRKPLSMGGEIQANAQRMNPFKPNNGNPRGANNMPAYDDTLNQGGKPMPGGFQDRRTPAPRPQGTGSSPPPMPAYNGIPANMYTGDPAVDSIIRYNLSTQRDRYDPGFGIMQSDSGTAEDRALMGLPNDAYQNMYTPDGRIRFDQLLQGRNAPPMPQGQGQGMDRGIDDWTRDRMRRQEERWRQQGGVDRNDFMRATTDGSGSFDQEGYDEAVARFNQQGGGGGNLDIGSGGNYQPSPQGYWDQGQNPQWGRYVPPMMQDFRNPTSWYNQGGYNYNLPGAAGQFPTLGGFLTPPRPNFTTPRVDYPGG
jgi:hypothetical protein